MECTVRHERHVVVIDTLVSRFFQHMWASFEHGLYVILASTGIVSGSLIVSMSETSCEVLVACRCDNMIPAQLRGTITVVFCARWHACCTCHDGFRAQHTAQTQNLERELGQFEQFFFNCDTNPDRHTTVSVRFFIKRS